MTEECEARLSAITLVSRPVPTEAMSRSLLIFAKASGSSELILHQAMLLAEAESTDPILASRAWMNFGMSR